MMVTLSARKATYTIPPSTYYLAGFVFLLPIVASVPIRTLSISAHGRYSGWYRPRVPPFHARLYHPMESL